jgi:hypothetical protein
MRRSNSAHNIGETASSYPLIPVLLHGSQFYTPGVRRTVKRAFKLGSSIPVSIGMMDQRFFIFEHMAEGIVFGGDNMRGWREIFFASSIGTSPVCTVSLATEVSILQWGEDKGNWCQYVTNALLYKYSWMIVHSCI